MPPEPIGALPVGGEPGSTPGRLNRTLSSRLARLAAGFADRPVRLGELTRRRRTIPHQDCPRAVQTSHSAVRRVLGLETKCVAHGAKIVSPVRRQLSFTHFKRLTHIDDCPKRDFYTKMRRV